MEPSNAASIVSSEEAREKATALIALAARRWCLRGREGDGEGGERLIGDLMAAHGWVGRCRTSAGQPLFESIADLVEAWSSPMSEWLPGAPDEPLVRDGQPTALCEDLADEAGPEPTAEVEQRFMERVTQRLARRDDGPKVYSEFRRFLIEHASASEAEIRRWAIQVDAVPAEMFERIRSWATGTTDRRVYQHYEGGDLMVVKAQLTAMLRGVGCLRPPPWHPLREP